MCVSAVRGQAPPPPATLGVVQERVLDVLQDLAEELLAGLHAVQVH